MRNFQHQASDEKCKNIDKVELFNVLRAKITPLIRRSFGYAKDQETRGFKTTPKKNWAGY